MDPETNHQSNHQFRRLPKGERRVRFADSMGMELVSIFLFDLINTYYFASIHSHNKQQALPSPPTQQLARNSIITNKSSSHHNHHHHHHHLNNQSSLKSSSPPNTILYYQKQQHELHNQQLELRQYEQLHNQRQQQQKLSTHNNNNNNNNNSINNNHNHNHQSTISNNQQQQQQQQQHSSFICDFSQPISLISFKERVKLNKVHLETCHVNSRAGNISISCTIRVLNLSYDKAVIVRYTTDEWHTYKDCLASYKPGSNDGWSDRFTSTFSVANEVKEAQLDQRIIFAIKYTYDGDKVSWDSNGSLNYIVKKF